MIQTEGFEWMEGKTRKQKVEEGEFGVKTLIRKWHNIKLWTLTFYISYFLAEK